MSAACASGHKRTTAFPTVRAFVSWLHSITHRLSVKQLAINRMHTLTPQSSRSSRRPKRYRTLSPLKTVPCCCVTERGVGSCGAGHGHAQEGAEEGIHQRTWRHPLAAQNLGHRESKIISNKIKELPLQKCQEPFPPTGAFGYADDSGEHGAGGMKSVTHFKGMESLEQIAAKLRPTFSPS